MRATTPSTALRPLLALSLGACAIGFAPRFVRLSPLGPTATGFWRLALALPLLFILHLVFRHRHEEQGGAQRSPALPLPLPSTPSKPHLAREPIAVRDLRESSVRAAVDQTSAKSHGRFAWLWLILPGFFFAGDLALWHWSIHYTSVANSTLLTNFAPIFVTIAAYFFLGERFDRRFPVGLVLALTGAGLLVLSGSGSKSALASELGNGDGESLRLFGDFLGVLTALFYAAYQLSVKRLREDFSTLALMLGSTLTGAVLLLTLALANGETLWPAHARLPAELLLDMLPLVGLAWVSHIAGQGLIAYAFAHLSASFSSVSLLIQPVVAAIGAYYLFGESLGPVALLGAAIVLAGVVLARLATTSGAKLRGPSGTSTA